MADGGYENHSSMSRSRKAAFLTGCPYLGDFILRKRYRNARVAAGNGDSEDSAHPSSRRGSTDQAFMRRFSNRRRSSGPNFNIKRYNTNAHDVGYNMMAKEQLKVIEEDIEFIADRKKTGVNTMLS